jgi:hypothetical protein
MSQEVMAVQFYQTLNPKVLEYMLENLSLDIENGKYISANIRARIILDLANRALLPKNVIALCFQVQNILDSQGYTEENFLKQMNKSASKLMLECPPDTVKKESGQDCDPGYEELKGSSPGFKCCLKIQKELQKMDDDNLKILKDLNDKDVQLYQEFQARFGLGGTAKTERQGVLDHIDDIPAPILKVAQNMVKSDALDTQIKIQTDIENKDFKKAAERVGMSEKLFSYLWQKTGGAVEWFTSHDYSSWFTVIFLVRLIFVVLCWIKLLYDAGGSLFQVIVNLIFKALGSSTIFTDFKGFVWGMTMFVTQLFLRGATSFITQTILQTNSTLAKIINVPTWFYSKFINMVSFSLFIGQMILIGLAFYTGGAAVVAGTTIASSLFSVFSNAFCTVNTKNVFDYIGQGFLDMLSAFMLYICQSCFTNIPGGTYACSFLPGLIQTSKDFIPIKTAVASVVAQNTIGVVGSMFI